MRPGISERMAAFAKRALWWRGLGTTGYTDQINNMVTHFGDLGLVENRPGPGDASFPAEMQVFSRRHFGTLGQMTEIESSDLASILSVARRKYDHLFGLPMPLMMLLRQSPARGEHPYFHFHVEFYPIQRSAAKLKYLAGVETGTGTFLNDTVAEERAIALRAAEPVS
jgi:UDPglucose--hexose-1-phosphate uridylyltransferase